MSELAAVLNGLAGTSGLEVAGAANVWAGTSGLELLGALNVKNSSVGIGFDEVCRQLAGLSGGESGLAALGALGAADSFDPLDIPWHTVFYADDLVLSDDDPVSTWADSSGNGNDATQGTATKRPVLKAAVAALNGQPAVFFDGVDDEMLASFTAVTQPFTYVFVVNRAGAASGNYALIGTLLTQAVNETLWLADSRWESRYGSLSGVGRTENPALLESFASGASSSLVGNGGSTGGSFGTASTDIMRLGNRTNNLFLNGHIAFAGLLERELTAQEKSDLRDWAGTKYAFTMA